MKRNAGRKEDGLCLGCRGSSGSLIGCSLMPNMPREMEQQAIAAMHLVGEISGVLKRHEADAEMAIGVLVGLLEIKVSQPENLAAIDAEGREFMSNKLIEIAVAMAGGGRG